MTLILFAGLQSITYSQPLPGRIPIVISCKGQLSQGIKLLNFALNGVEAMLDMIDDRATCLDNMDWVYILAIDYFGSWDRYQPDREFCKALELGFAVERGEDCKYRFGINVETGETGCKLMNIKSLPRATCPYLDFNALGSDYDCCAQWNVIQTLLNRVASSELLAQATWGGYEDLGCVGRDEAGEQRFRRLQDVLRRTLDYAKARYGFIDFSGKCKMVDLSPIKIEKKPLPDVDQAEIE